MLWRFLVGGLKAHKSGFGQLYVHFAMVHDETECPYLTLVYDEKEQALFYPKYLDGQLVVASGQKWEWRDNPELDRMCLTPTQFSQLAVRTSPMEAPLQSALPPFTLSNAVVEMVVTNGPKEVDVLAIDPNSEAAKGAMASLLVLMYAWMCPQAEEGRGVFSHPDDRLLIGLLRKYGGLVQRAALHEARARSHGVTPQPTTAPLKFAQKPDVKPSHPAFPEQIPVPAAAFTNAHQTPVTASAGAMQPPEGYSKPLLRTAKSIFADALLR